MAWRLGECVARGEIDNRVRGRVEGRVWLAGIERPLVLRLEGNCLRDIAGTLLTFENPAPRPGEVGGELHAEQEGVVGDMTASRKIRVFAAPVATVEAQLKLGVQPPSRLANAIYLEWYSQRNGRVVIESADFAVTISEPVWTMTETEEQGQREANANAIGVWLERLTQAASAAARREEIDADKRRRGDDSEADEAMDEFAWERFFQDADARTDKLMQLEERYAGLAPEERERAIAREMGWIQIEEFLEAEAKGELPQADADGDGKWFDDDGFEDEPQPDPATEGVDWVLDTGGRPVHPLAKKAHDIHVQMHLDCQAAGLLGEDAKRPLRDLLFCSHMLSTKLAGALNSLWMERPPEPAFVVAYLKRALPFFNEGMGHWQTVFEAETVDRERLLKHRDDLCAVREEILRLMNHYRRLDGGQ